MSQNGDDEESDIVVISSVDCEPRRRVATPAPTLAAMEVLEIDTDEYDDDQASDHTYVEPAEDDASDHTYAEPEEGETGEKEQGKENQDPN